MMRCPVMQLSVTVEGMDITDRQATGTARAIHLTVNDRQYILGPNRRKARAAGDSSGQSLTGMKKRPATKAFTTLPATGVSPMMVNAVSPAVGRRIRPRDAHLSPPARQRGIRVDLVNQGEPHDRHHRAHRPDRTPASGQRPRQRRAGPRDSA